MGGTDAKSVGRTFADGETRPYLLRVLVQHWTRVKSKGSFWDSTSTGETHERDSMFRIDSVGYFIEVSLKIPFAFQPFQP